jgi:hypothetical protein
MLFINCLIIIDGFKCIQNYNWHKLHGIMRAKAHIKFTHISFCSVKSLIWTVGFTYFPSPLYTFYIFLLYIKWLGNLPPIFCVVEDLRCPVTILTEHSFLQLHVLWRSGKIFIDEAYHNKPLLPHSLKNTGNLCFLNATLQAFFS